MHLLRPHSVLSALTNRVTSFSLYNLKRSSLFVQPSWLIMGITVSPFPVIFLFIPNKLLLCCSKHKRYHILCAQWFFSSNMHHSLGVEKSECCLEIVIKWTVLYENDTFFLLKNSKKREKRRKKVEVIHSKQLNLFNLLRELAHVKSPTREITRHIKNVPSCENVALFSFPSSIKI